MDSLSKKEKTQLFTVRFALLVSIASTVFSGYLLHEFNKMAPRATESQQPILKSENSANKSNLNFTVTLLRDKKEINTITLKAITNEERNIVLMAGETPSIGVQGVSALFEPLFIDDKGNVAAKVTITATSVIGVDNFSVNGQKYQAPQEAGEFVIRYASLFDNTPLSLAFNLPNDPGANYNLKMTVQAVH